MDRVKVCIETKYITIEFIKRYLKLGLLGVVDLFKYLEVTYHTKDGMHYKTVADTLTIPSFSMYITDSIEDYENLLQTYIILGILDTESLRAPPFRPLN